MRLGRDSFEGWGPRTSRVEACERSNAAANRVDDTGFANRSVGDRSGFQTVAGWALDFRLPRPRPGARLGGRGWHWLSLCFIE